MVRVNCPGKLVYARGENSTKSAVILVGTAGDFLQSTDSSPTSLVNCPLRSYLPLQRLLWLNKRNTTPRQAGIRELSEYCIRDTFVTLSLAVGEDPGWVAAAAPESK